MKVSDKAKMETTGNSGDIYQIGVPADKLSTVAMLWISYGRPCKFIVYPSQKNEDWAVVELRNDILASEIITYVTNAMVNIIKNQPNKYVHV